MCRLAVFSNLKIKGSWLDLLTTSNGGDGEGFVSPAPLKEVRKEKVGQTLDEKVDIYHIKRWYISEQYNGTVAYYGLYRHGNGYGYSFRPSTDYEHRDIESPWLMFHTRIRSAGGLGIKNTHPAVAKDSKGFVLVMQNGHEPDMVERIALYKGLSELFDGTDYKTLAELLLLTKDFDILWLTSNSNWFILHGQTLLVYSGKERDPLYYYEHNGGFYIASEPLEEDHYGGKYFNGLIKFKVTKEGLVYISEKTDNIRVRKKPVKKSPATQSEADRDIPPFDDWNTIEKEEEEQ